MKNTNQCPKCGCTNIIRIPRSWLQGNGGNFIPVGWGFTNIGVTRFVCEDCGFSEEWIEDEYDLNILKEEFQKRKK